MTKTLNNLSHSAAKDLKRAIKDFFEARSVLDTQLDVVHTAAQDALDELESFLRDAKAEPEENQDPDFISELEEEIALLEDYQAEVSNMTLDEVPSLNAEFDWNYSKTWKE